MKIILKPFISTTNSQNEKKILRSLDLVKHN